MHNDTAAAQEVARARKDRVHTSMLIELLSLLVFLAMAFAFVMKEEGERVNPWKEKYDQVSKQLTAAELTIRNLKADLRRLSNENAQLKRSIQRLLSDPNAAPPSANEKVLVPRDLIEKLAAESANSQALVDELQAENQRLRGMLAAASGHGVDLPACRVSPGFLVAVDLLSDGTYRVTPRWTQGAADTVATIPGVRELATGAPLTRQQFLAQATRIQRWGREQPIACGFKAVVTNRHQSLDLYKKQVATVEQAFYVRRN